jgi:hypothetical protein
VIDWIENIGDSSNQETRAPPPEKKMENQTPRCPEDDMSGEELEAYYAELWREEVELMQLTQEIDEEFEKELNEIFPERW